MTLAPGSRLGPYELLAQIGAGGMGIVFRARDTRLGRDVAIKVLPEAYSTDPERLRRFQQEARAVGSLNHPNIMAIHDTGVHEGTPYLVMELLEGETLRAKLNGRPIPPKRAVDITFQIAQGLAAAHGQGLIHRDLKPENIFLTRDGRVKILDFGLAKTIKDACADLRTEAVLNAITSIPAATAVGQVMGTAGYMSPEQVRGGQLDGRSDLFCVGLILWEMLTGLRPFQRGSPVETMHAILTEELPEPGPELALTPLLERVLHSCLAKDPEGRFHSAHDLAFALEASTLSESSGLPHIRKGRGGRSGPKPGLVWAALAAALGGALWAFLAQRPVAPPSFTRITFAPGFVDAAFFSADGRSVYFSGRFQGRQPEIYVRSPESPEPRSLAAQGAVLAGVSRANELAVLREPRYLYKWGGFLGTLATLHGGGGAFRDLLENVNETAWDGESRSFAVLTMDKGFRSRLEFPAGNLIHSSLGTLTHLCLSRAGDRLAVVDGDGDASKVMTFDTQGRAKVLLTKSEDSFATTITGLAWHPGGNELWASEQQGDQTVVWALDLRGGKRMVWRGPGSLRLMDMAADGRALVSVQQSRRGVLLQRQGQTQARDLSVLDGTQAVAFLPNGKTLLLLESSAIHGGTSQDWIYLRDTDGGQALRLCKGIPRSLSRDGKFIGINAYDLTPNASLHDLRFIPTGAGLPVTLNLARNFQDLDDMVLMDNGQRAVFAGLEAGGDWRFYVASRAGGQPRAFTPVGTRAPRPLILSPDGTCMIGETTNRGEFVRWLVDGSGSRPIPGLQPGEIPLAWTQDGIYVSGGKTDLPVQVARLDAATGRRQPVTTFMPPDTAGYMSTVSVRLTQDARAFAFTYDRKTSDLFIVEGLR